MGSGSTGKAAVLEGFKFMGIEREKEYFSIAEARIQYVSDEKVDSPDETEEDREDIEAALNLLLSS